MKTFFQAISDVVPILSLQARYVFCLSAVLMLVGLTPDLLFSQNDRTSVAVLQDDQIDEASGLAISRNYPGVFWTHNDSGDQARVFAIDSLGATVHTVYLDGIVARDWEDLSIMEDEDGKFFLLIAEIGDNNKRYDYYSIHKIPEPDIKSQTMSRSEVETLNFRYEDGPQNAETLALDASANRLVIANKGNTKVNLYEIPTDFSNSDTLTAHIFGTVEMDKTVLGGLSSQGGVGGDIKAGRLLMKSYDNIYLFDLADLSSPPNILPYIMEVQGEALAFGPDGSAYYTLSEERGGVPATIYRYKFPLRLSDPESLSEEFELLEVDGRVRKGDNLDISFRLKTPVEIQVYISQNGSPVQLLLDDEVQESALLWSSTDFEVGSYQLLFVSDSFTVEKEVEVW